jgi:hypothetical protein
MMHTAPPFRWLTRGGLPTLAASIQAVGLAGCHVDGQHGAEGSSGPVAPKPAPALAPPTEAPPVNRATVPPGGPPSGLPPAEGCPPGATPQELGVEGGRERFCEKDGRRHGRYTFFGNEGHKQGEVEYVDGQQEGPYFGWDEQGRLYETGNYSKGQRVGRWRSWREGLLAFEGDFVDSLQHGGFIAWHDTGKKQGEGQFRKGQPCGPFLCWNPEGTADECKPLEGSPCTLTPTGADCPPCAPL